MSVRLEVLDVISAGGGTGRFNEDSVGWSDHALWVVDGATSLDTTSGRLETSARWISTETSRILGRIMSQSAGYCVPPARVGAVAQCLRERWNNTAPVHKNGTLLPPAASLGLVQIDSEAGRAGLLSVGDCMVFHAGPEGDVRSIVVDETTMRAEQRRVAARGNGHTRSGITSEMVQDRLGYIAGRGGNVLSVDPQVADRVTEATVSPGHEDLFLLCTDGFARVVNLPMFHGCWATTVKTVMRRGLAWLLETLRESERIDRAFTRGEYKTSDDATALLARYSTINPSPPES